MEKVYIGGNVRPITIEIIDLLKAEYKNTIGGNWSIGSMIDLWAREAVMKSTNADLKRRVDEAWNSETINLESHDEARSSQEN